MARNDDAFALLREAIDALAIELAPELVAEARAEAVAKARRVLSDAMLESLLDHAATEMGAGGRPRQSPPPPRRRQRSRKAPSDAVETIPPETARRRPETEVGCYVYGIAWAVEAGLPEDLVGVDPRHPAMLIKQGDLAAIASLVSLSEFGEEELRENLNDVAWLEEKARAHEHVLDQALARTTVVPMRLCTIYTSEAQVREMLGREQEIFAEALHRLEGKTEWGVKLIADPGAVDRAAAGVEGRGEEESDTPTPGVAYLREKSLQNRARELGTEVAEEWARQAHEMLASRASEALRNPLQNPELSGETGEMLLNGVYLVDDRSVDEFRDAVAQVDERFRERGASAELTGPWPPYNFVKGSIEAAR